MNILGINFYGHDTSAAIVVNGKLIAAVEEERLSRKKHDASFPVNSVKFCLDTAGLKLKDIDCIAVSKIFDRLFREKYINYTIENFPKANGIFLQSFHNMSLILNAERQIRDTLKYDGKIEYLHHHLCHVASSYYLSGFRESAAVSVDGLGEIESTLICHAKGKSIEVLSAVNYPHSLGMLYQAFTYYLGFKPNSAEGTVMALASFGNPNAKLNRGKRYIDVFEEITTTKKNGSFEFDLSYFNYPFTREGWVSEKLIETLGPQRIPDSPITAHHKNVAAALQKCFEDMYIHIMNYAQSVTGSKNLSLAGGCALNCVGNGLILEKTRFRDLYIQPAASDSGTAIGAALLLSFGQDKKAKLSAQRRDTYLGPSFDNSRIRRAIVKSGFAVKKVTDPALVAAELLAAGKIIGWFQGKMEFGPRALGNRSILAKPFPIGMKDVINNNVKHREPFRPFAPSILKDDRFLSQYYEPNGDSPFMLIAYKTKMRNAKKIIATIHVDKTSRVQTVDENVNPLYFNLISHFHKLTGVPLVLNTSFNDKGEPIVCTPEDALRTFEKTQLDALVMGSYVIER